jgi:hypothetical protein
VSDLDTLLALLQEHPEDDLLVAMAADCCAETHDITPLEGQQRVAAIVGPLRAARRIARAVALLQSGTSTRRYLMRRIYHAASVPAGYRPTVLVTDGDAVTVNMRMDEMMDDAYWGRTVITVGASWLQRQLAQRSSAADREHGRTRRWRRHY